MKLWLDDVRPAPDGWYHAKTVAQAQALIQGALHAADPWEEASLDHDLGVCGDCVETCGSGPWPIVTVKEGNCDHNGTGYQLVVWMAEYGLWPVQKPLVHSWNPVGKKAMEAVIERHFPR